MLMKFTSLLGTFYRTEYDVFIGTFLYIANLRPREKSPVDSRLLFVSILLASILFDIFWYWVVYANWNEDNDIYWEKEKKWYTFGVFWSGLNMIIKVRLSYQAGAALGIALGKDDDATTGGYKPLNELQ